MKKLLLFFLCLLSIYVSSSYASPEKDYEKILVTDDQNLKLKLLETQQEKTCEKGVIYASSCAARWRQIASVALLAKQYSRAVQAVERSYTIYPSNSFATRCWNSWDLNDIPRKENDDINKIYQNLEQQGLNVSIAMVYYQALKGGNDSRTKDNLNLAYLCELDGSTIKNMDKIIDKYMQDSLIYQNSVEQTYTKRFINEIYIPIEQSKNKFYQGKYDNEYNAKLYKLYQNAFIQAKKIGLPVIYQDYLSRYIEYYNRNK